MKNTLYESALTRLGDNINNAETLASNLHVTDSPAVISKAKAIQRRMQQTYIEGLVMKHCNSSKVKGEKRTAMAEVKEKAEQLDVYDNLPKAIQRFMSQVTDLGMPQ